MLSAAIGKYLAAQLAALTFDATGATGNVFVEWMPSTPDLAIAVMTQPGQSSLSKMPDDRPGVQVLVRGTRNNPRDGYDLARSIFGELAGLDLVTLDDAGVDEVFLIGCSPLQSEPVSIGQDANERFEWSLNFTCHTYNPTTHRS